MSEDVAVLSVLPRGEIDVQISTAKAFPRAVSQFQATLKSLATLNEATAEACIFALPRSGKTIEGPSIRFAEVALTAWGNARVKAVIVDPGIADPEHVTVEGQFWDLETNAGVARQVKRRIVSKEGKRYNADMVMQTINACASIAIRNATLSGIPRALWEDIYQEARRVVAGDAQTLANRRAHAVEYLGKFGVRSDMILATLKKATLDDLDLNDIVALRASARAIRDGETTVEDAFIDPKVEAAKAEAAAKAGVAGLKGELVASPPTPETPEQTTIPTVEEGKKKK